VYDPNWWETFKYSLYLTLREKLNENGVFINTNHRVVIPEPTGEVAKFVNGYSAIISRLI
jgi:hypothetical protein